MCWNISSFRNSVFGALVHLSLPLSKSNSIFLWLNVYISISHYSLKGFYMALRFIYFYGSFPLFQNTNMDNPSELARKTFKHRKTCLSFDGRYVFIWDRVLIRIFTVQILKMKHSQGNQEVSKTNASMKTETQVSNIINIGYW